MTKIPRFAALFLAGVIIAAVFLLFPPGAERMISAGANRIEMGTAVSVTVYAEKGRSSEGKRREQLSGLASRILDAIDELDRNRLSWRSEDSEVFRFDQPGEAGSMTVSPELAEVIRGSLAISEASGGALDITLRPVIEAWGIESFDGKNDYVPPSDAELEEAAASAGAEHLVLREELNGEFLLEKDIPGLSLDLGAVGKGYALDAAAGMLSASGASGAVLAAGGSILAYGDKGEPWKIGIRDPEGSPYDSAGILSIPGEKGMTAFISTSGGYEKYVEYQGMILEHIIDGRTMRPAESGLYSATVVTRDSGLASDGLSTACYLLGMKESLPLLERWQAEAVFITRDRQIWVTEGLADAFSLTAPGYTLARVLN